MLYCKWHKNIWTLFKQPGHSEGDQGQQAHVSAKPWEASCKSESISTDSNAENLNFAAEINFHTQTTVSSSWAILQFDLHLAALTKPWGPQGCSHLAQCWPSSSPRLSLISTCFNFCFGSNIRKTMRLWAISWVWIVKNATCSYLSSGSVYFRCHFSSDVS